MWPIFFGFATGAVAYQIQQWLSAQLAGLTHPLTPVATDPQRATLVRLLWALAWLTLLLIFVVVLPSTIALESIPAYRDWLWIIFRHTTTGSFLIAAFAGVLCASWYGDSRSHDSPNLLIRGVGVGAFTLLILAFGLNNEYGFVNRINKLSSSVVSIEFDRSLRDERPEMAANTSSESANVAWATEERIGFALLVAEDVSTKALGRDQDVIELVGGSAPAGLIEANRSLLEAHLLPLVKLRRDLHATKRNSSPIFFDSDAFDQVRLALALRELVVADLRDSGGLNLSRDVRLDAVASAYGSYVASTKRAICLFAGPIRIKRLEKEQLELRQDLEKLQGPARLRKEVEADAAAALLDKARYEEAKDCPLATDATAFKTEAGAQAESIRDAIPAQVTVSRTPYLAIVSASLLFGAGEREAAASLLDLWWRAAVARAKQADDVQERVFIVRVLNLIALLLSDRSHPAHMELNWHYQKMALDESDAVIDKHPKLKRYLEVQRFSEPEKYDILAAAARPYTDRRNRCDDTQILSEGARYFVFRRSTLLNNAVYFLSIQRDLLEQPGMGHRFDELIEELRSIRVDCLANMSTDSRKSGSEWQAQRAEKLSTTLETLAQALLTRAWLRRADSKVSRGSLCAAYQAAVVSERLAAVSRDPVVTRQEFVERSFAENVEAIGELATIRSIRKLVRDLRRKVESLNEGGCNVAVDEPASAGGKQVH